MWLIGFHLDIGKLCDSCFICIEVFHNFQKNFGNSSKICRNHNFSLANLYDPNLNIYIYIYIYIDLKFINVKNPSAEVELRLYIQAYSNRKELLVGDAWSLSMISQIKYQTVFI